MRPTKLTMTAFGVYSNTTVIDFDKLGKQGLYLITGDTGAGKTTIFDAICFALFGELSGTFRKSEMFRSRYAAPGAKTEVELEFDYRGESYTITRWLSFERAKQRGEGTKSEEGGAKLIFPDKSALEKTTEVNAAVENLLGINKDQFKQIVMLAQGDFRKMLFSDTKERAQIFRKIFDTELYEKFEGALKEKHKTAEDAFKTAKTKALEKVSSVKCDESGELCELRQQIKDNELPNLPTLDEFCVLLNAQNAADDNINKSFAEKLDEIRKTKDKLLEEFGSEKKNNESFAEAEKLRERLPELEKTAEDNKLAASNLEKENNPKIDGLKQQITRLGDTLAEYKKLEEGYEKLGELKRQLVQKSADRDNLRKSRGELSNQLEALKAEADSLKNAGANLEKLNAEKDKTERRITDVSALLKAVSDLEKKAGAFERCQNDYLNAKRESDRLGETARQLRGRFNDEQAGIMAAKLTEGEPCPVCGSTHHPNKKAMSEGAPSEAEVERAEELAKNASDAANTLSANSAAAKGAYDEATNSVTGMIERLALNCGLDNAKETASAELENLDEQLDETKNALRIETANNERRGQLEKLVPQNEKTLAEMNDLLNNLEKQIASDETEAKAKENQLAEQKAKLDFENESAAQAEIDKLKASVGTLERELVNAREKSEQSNRNHADALTRLDTISKQLPPDYAPVNLDEKQAELQRLGDEETALSENAKDVEFRLKNNESILKALTESIPKLQKLEKERDILDNLYNVVIGNIGSKTKLETFVQMRYFRDILRNANIHFKTMSNDQYEFVRKVVPGDKRTDRTLDLDIRDYYNGTTRDVKSLSGGESFVASLSLALGLSDTVQQNAGGIRLETMFVDEGFGSLDDETLRQAMKALTTLTESDRIIGIISHVDAVKRDISKKIIVKKDGANGSTAEIIV